MPKVLRRASWTICRATRFRSACEGHTERG